MIGSEREIEALRALMQAEPAEWESLPDAERFVFGSPVVILCDSENHPGRRQRLGALNLGSPKRGIEWGVVPGERFTCRRCGDDLPLTRESADAIQTRVYAVRLAHVEVSVLTLRDIRVLLRSFKA